MNYSSTAQSEKSRQMFYGRLLYGSVVPSIFGDRVRNLFDRRTLIGVQAAYYYNTMFGPLGGTLGYSNHTKEPYFYLNPGYDF